jgi:hypothetical protein
LGKQARKQNDNFKQSYNQMINLFTKQFSNDFCKEDGEIDWKKLLKFNSGSKNEKK